MAPSSKVNKTEHWLKAVMTDLFSKFSSRWSLNSISVCPEVAGILKVGRGSWGDGNERVKELSWVREIKKSQKPVMRVGLSQLD